ncbi:hypothetical protein [Nostoc sp.]|uniref:hypothetical protein n=1 Tax=Nostoc sp. TaxID=1180 RepID=UPI002FF494D8
MEQLTTAPTVSTIAQAIGNNNANNLDGTWDYQVSLPESQCSVQGACSIKIVGSIGHYVLPTNTDNKNGVFLVNVYPTTINRGQPVVTITGIGSGLTQKLSQTLIPLCRASCFKSGNPPNALASLRPLRFVFWSFCVSPMLFAKYVSKLNTHQL